MSVFPDAQYSPINGLRYAPEWAGTNLFLSSAPVADRVDTLYPEELPAIESAASLRRCTFSSGRSCARAALAEAGLAPGPLPRAEDGAVVWPPGVIGSISHTSDWAVAAVAVDAMSEAVSLGVDLECIQPIESGVLAMVATRAEIAELAEAGDRPWHSTALFSLKESIYKCLRPSHGQFIQFHEVEIGDIACGRPQLRLLSDELNASYPAAAVQLRLAVTPAHVFTLAWLRDL
ncbi:MAG: 4'-phosphopantetheinyl transferase superfamily protein [Granulosicoccus sp.]|nr:4'-phosphopantetheinyl transferase superfamily protein [Granulosicoccus sp.]